MRTTIAAVAAALLLVGCGTSTGDIASDEPPGDRPTSPSGAPTVITTAIPAADGIVATRNLVTVMDTGDPVLCLGAVAESYPPQCSGPPIAGWSWKDQQGAFEKSGDIRWGLFSLQGTWDGRTFTVTSSIPAALYDTGPVEEPPTGDAGPVPDEEEILRSLERDPLPGTLTVVPAGGVITVDVVHDDGSIQADATARFGDAVTVTSALVPIQR